MQKDIAELALNELVETGTVSMSGLSWVAIKQFAHQYGFVIYDHETNRITHGISLFVNAVVFADFYDARPKEIRAGDLIRLRHHKRPVWNNGDKVFKRQMSLKHQTLVQAKKICFRFNIAPKMFNSTASDFVFISAVLDAIGCNMLGFANLTHSTRSQSLKLPRSYPSRGGKEFVW